MKRAKADAKSDDFGAVWTQVRRCPDSLKRAKPDAKSDDFGAVCRPGRMGGRGCVIPRIRVKH